MLNFPFIVAVAARNMENFRTLVATCCRWFEIMSMENFSPICVEIYLRLD